MAPSSHRRGDTFARVDPREKWSEARPSLVQGAEEDDVALLARVRGGDAHALGRLYDRYSRVLFGVAYRMVGAPETAEEVMQDAFHAVWRRASTYDPARGGPRGWLLTIVRNAAIDRQRVVAPRSRRESSLDDALETPDDDSVEERASSDLRDERIRSVVATLSPEQRQVIQLAFWGGLSQTEIAARLGIPLGTVKSRVRLAMSKLRAGLVDERD